MWRSVNTLYTKPNLLSHYFILYYFLGRVYTIPDSISCLHVRLSDIVYNHTTRKSNMHSSPLQTDATSLLAKNSQYCWMLYVASVCTRTLLHAFRCYWELLRKVWNQSNFKLVHCRKNAQQILGVVYLSSMWWSTFISVRQLFAPLQLVYEKKLYPTWFSCRRKPCLLWCRLRNIENTPHILKAGIVWKNSWSIFISVHLGALLLLWHQPGSIRWVCALNRFHCG